MNFTIKAKYLKTLWQGQATETKPSSQLILVKNIADEKEWTMFTTTELSMDTVYQFDGHVSRTVNKKYRNEKNMLAPDYSFNVTNVVIDDNIPF